jgi:hypothetical protein
LALVPAGSPLTVSAGHFSTDTAVPGALIRLHKTMPTSGSSSGTTSYRYDGTYSQDTATRDIYLYRLPTGERLDRPAKVLPGTWESSTKIKSRFVVAGKIRAEYALTVDAAETIDTSIGRKPVCVTHLSTQWYSSMGKGQLTTSKQWFEPTSGSYLQAKSRNAKIILDDLILVEILDEKKSAPTQ